LALVLRSRNGAERADELLGQSDTSREEQTMSQQDLVVGWLNDAYAMERSITQVLQRHVKDAKDLPEVQTRLQQHLDATERHAELVQGCVERLGGDTSKLKSGVAQVMGAVQGMSTSLAKDELVKNALQDYSTEHMEIASYQSLLAAAQQLGDTETASVCEQILQDEEAMQAWLREQIPTITRQVLEQQGSS
jgi:ferritin-like metal-binding protein YciE